MEKLVGLKLLDALKVNMANCCYIEKIEPIWNEGSLEGTDDLKGIVLTLDNPVKTQLTITAMKGILGISLSQLESVAIQKTYLKNY